MTERTSLPWGIFYSDPVFRAVFQFVLPFAFSPALYRMEKLWYIGAILIFLSERHLQNCPLLSYNMESSSSMWNEVYSIYKWEWKKARKYFLLFARGGAALPLAERRVWVILAEGIRSILASRRHEGPQDVLLANDPHEPVSFHDGKSVDVVADHERGDILQARVGVNGDRVRRHCLGDL